MTYRLKLPASWRIHNVFHAVLLRHYKENEVYGENFTQPPPEVVEGEDVEYTSLSRLYIPHHFSYHLSYRFSVT